MGTRVLFVTGRLAEPSLRRVAGEVAEAAGIEPLVAVLPISVAALMTTRWASRRLEVPEGVERVILPGHCRGDLAEIEALSRGAKVEVGPEDLRDLPRWFGQADRGLEGYGAYTIEILAEVNHAPRRTLDDIVREAEHYCDEGADRIDLGCDPDGPWTGVGDAVRALVERGRRVSIDSFDAVEVADATRAGADLVLSVNASNRERAVDWGVEVVAIPDRPGTLEGLDDTVNWLEKRGVRFRLDPILEPIGFGFARSLGRYIETRRRYPDASILMGIGNLTELTDVDSAGVNTLLVGFCQELNIQSVLTTEVISWARSSVREVDLARRLTHFAVENSTPPKHVEPRLVMLRDPRVARFGDDELRATAARVKDPNWRIFAEDGRIIAFNHSQYLVDDDPFRLFERMGVDDASHAFYLGYELSKARTALTLGKNYRQDVALEWGFLTRAEASRHERAGGLKPDGGEA